MGRGASGCPPHALFGADFTFRPVPGPSQRVLRVEVSLFVFRANGFRFGNHSAVNQGSHSFHCGFGFIAA